MNGHADDRRRISLKTEQLKVIYRGRTASVPQFIADQIFERERAALLETEQLLAFEGNCRSTIFKMLRKRDGNFFS